MFKVYNLQQQQQKLCLVKIRNWSRFINIKLWFHNDITLPLYYYTMLISCWNVWIPSAYVNSSVVGKAFTCSWLKGHAVFGTVTESTESDNDSGSGPSQSMP